MFNLTIVGINFEIDVIFSECKLLQLVMRFILYILPLSIMVCAASLILFSVDS